MARYTHDLMERGPDALGFGILGVGLMPGDLRMVDALAPQDALYTFVEREGADETVTVIGALAGFAFAGETSAVVLDAIGDPAIRDTVERVNTDVPLDVQVDAIRGRLQRGGVAFLALALAARLRRVRGVDGTGGPIEVRHPMSALLREPAIAGAADPHRCSASALFGELGDDPRLVEAVAKWISCSTGRASR